MTQFVDVPNMARWIQREGVEGIMRNMVKYLEREISPAGRSSTRSRAWPATRRSG